MIWWLTTAPNPRSPATGFDAGRRGWKQHAVEAPSEASFKDVRLIPAACGLLPAHGWDLDLHSEQMDKCIRCLMRQESKKEDRYVVETQSDNGSWKEVAKSSDLSIAERRASLFSRKNSDVRVKHILDDRIIITITHRREE